MFLLLSNYLLKKKEKQRLRNSSTASSNRVAPKLPKIRGSCPRRVEPLGRRFSVWSGLLRRQQQPKIIKIMIIKIMIIMIIIMIIYWAGVSASRAGC